MHEAQTEMGREGWPEDYAAPPIPADVVLPPSLGAGRPDDSTTVTKQRGEQE